MKKIAIILTLFLILTLGYNTMAQVPPPPPPDHGLDGNQNGGTAPIGSGLFVLLGLAGAYGVMKLRNKNKEELED